VLNRKGRAREGLRVLVLGDDTRSFLAVARSLGRKGHEVHAAPFDFASPALSSRYVTAVHRLPAYSLSAQAWLEALRRLVADNGFQLVIPCDDRTMVPLHRHAAEISGTRLALPNSEAMAVFFDKLETRRLAGELGVPTAPGSALSGRDSAERLAERYGLPLALKPRSSYTLGQAGAKSAVAIVRSVAEIEAALDRAQDRDDWLVEGYFDGVGVGVSVLAERGEVRLAFQHRRLRESSETGGSSSRISEAIDPAMLEAVKALAGATALHGVAMFEFRKDRRSGRHILLEVNARFWGSLPLAVAAGVDFPAALCDLYSGKTPEAPAGYRLGLKLQDLSGEYNRIIKSAEAAGSKAARLGLLARELGWLAVKLPLGRSFDSHAADDAAPWREDRNELLRSVGRAIARRMTSGQGRRRRARRAVRRLADALGQGPARLVLLCSGNICRSPFAEYMINAKVKEAGLPMEVVSVGTIALEGRSPPREAIEAARPYGADIVAHRSRYVDLDAIEHAGAVLVFDEQNVDALRQLGFNGEVNLLRLGDFSPAKEIEDPFGCGAAGYASAFAGINEAVENLVSDLARAGNYR
jgi:protein-tyrosine-phosphatase/predicted ATP-grasp superfamily ATP-dependent carboligase